MFDTSQLLIGKIRGSLAVSVIVVCSMIGAVVGIIGGGIMTSGSIALKPMLARGYDNPLAMDVIMAGGGLGILIPASIPMIMFAASTHNSIGRMFIGAMISALPAVVLMILYVVISCRISPPKVPFTAADKKTRRNLSPKSCLSPVAVFLQ